MELKKNRPKWPLVKWMPNRKSWMVDARTKDGGQRRFFPKRVDAEEWAEKQKTLRKKEGADAFNDVELRKYGWTVADAIKLALSHLKAKHGSIALAEAVRSLIEAKKTTGRSERYCNDLRLRLGRLSRDFEGRNIGEITATELEGFLQNLKVGPETRNTFRRDCRTLWSFAEKRGWVSTNVAKRTERARIIDQPPGVLTPEQAEALLKASHHPELLAFHAIGLFAGLRVAEIERLVWENIDLESGYIEVSAAASKTRSRRLVPIQPNLKQWLNVVLPRKLDSLLC